MKVTLLWLLSALLPLSAVLAEHKENVATDGSVDITLKRWAKEVPINGMVQLEVEVKNKLAEPGTWTFRTDSRGSGYQDGTTFSSHLTLSAGAGGVARGTLFMHCVPVLDGDRARYMQDARLYARGPGVKEMIPYGLDSVDVSSASSSTHSSKTNNRVELVAVSSAFMANHREQWRRVFQDTIDDGLRVQELPLNSCPTDWRGLTGYSQLWMLGSEWSALSEAQRLALKGWVAVGGSLYVSAKDEAVLTGIQPGQGEVRLLGLGRISTLIQNDSMPYRGPLVEGPKDLKAHSALALSQQTSSAAKGGLLGFNLPEMSLPTGLIFGFIVIFGIIVGPVNLFWFAPATRRPRLFWTTPLISLLGTLVLVLIMLVKDGVGGKGVRVVLATLLPEQKQMAVLQHQMVQTGLLFGRSFSLPEHEPVWLLPQPHRPGRPTGDGTVQAVSYDLKDGLASGDWFRSRSEQTLLVHSLRMNRGEVAVQWGQQPAVVSSLSCELAELYVRDEKGSLWHAVQVPTGQRTVLKQVLETQMMEWMNNKVLNHCGALVAQRLQTQREAAVAWFFALAQEHGKLGLPTLSSVSWVEDKAILTGPITSTP
jgi:hypothetical protein